MSDEGIKRFPLQLASSIEFDCRHYWVLFSFEVCFEFFGDSFKYVPFTDVTSVTPRSNLNSVPLESEVNLLALVIDKAHQVAYFLFFRALVEWSSESKFAVLIKSFPLFTQVRSGPIHRWPVVRRVNVTFCHFFVLGFVRRHSKSHYFDTMLHINN